MYDDWRVIFQQQLQQYLSGLLDVFVQRKELDERMHSHYYYYFMIDYQINLSEMMT